MPNIQPLLDHDIARVASTYGDEVDVPAGESLQIELLADRHPESLRESHYYCPEQSECQGRSATRVQAPFSTAFDCFTGWVRGQRCRKL